MKYENFTSKEKLINIIKQLPSEVKGIVNFELHTKRDTYYPIITLGYYNKKDEFIKQTIELKGEKNEDC